MRTSLLTTIAAAALIAGAGVSYAQQANTPGSTGNPPQATDQNPSSGMQSQSQTEPGTAMKNPAKQGRSVSMKKHHHARHAMRTTEQQGRSVSKKHHMRSSRHGSSTQSPAGSTSGTAQSAPGGGY